MQQVEKLKKEILKMSLEAEQDQLSALDSEVFVATSCLSCEEGEKSRQSLMVFCATNGPWWLLRAIMEKERADKYEGLVREQENQIDILSTTLAMYCSPYYDMQERAEKAEALVRELLEVMMSVAYQECGYEENGITKFDSMAIGARMELLLTLIEHGRLEEINSFGRRVIAKLPGAKEVLGDE